MLVSAKDMLEKARDGKYAVGQFNINNLRVDQGDPSHSRRVKIPGHSGRIRGRREIYDWI